MSSRFGDFLFLFSKPEHYFFGFMHSLSKNRSKNFSFALFFAIPVQFLQIICFSAPPTGLPEVFREVHRFFNMNGASYVHRFILFSGYILILATLYALFLFSPNLRKRPGFSSFVSLCFWMGFVGATVLYLPVLETLFGAFFCTTIGETSVMTALTTCKCFDISQTLFAILAIPLLVIFLAPLLVSCLFIFPSSPNPTRSGLFGMPRARYHFGILLAHMLLVLVSHVADPDFSIMVPVLLIIVAGACVYVQPYYSMYANMLSSGMYAASFAVSFMLWLRLKGVPVTPAYAVLGIALFGIAPGITSVLIYLRAHILWAFLPPDVKGRSVTLKRTRYTVSAPFFRTGRKWRKRFGRIMSKQLKYSEADAVERSLRFLQFKTYRRERKMIQYSDGLYRAALSQRRFRHNAQLYLSYAVFSVAYQCNPTNLDRTASLFQKVFNLHPSWEQKSLLFSYMTRLKKDTSSTAEKREYAQARLAHTQACMSLRTACVLARDLTPKRESSFSPFALTKQFLITLSAANKAQINYRNAIAMGADEAETEATDFSRDYQNFRMIFSDTAHITGDDEMQDEIGQGDPNLAEMGLSQPPPWWTNAPMSPNQAPEPTTHSALGYFPPAHHASTQGLTPSGTGLALSSTRLVLDAHTQMKEMGEEIRVAAKTPFLSQKMLGLLWFYIILGILFFIASEAITLSVILQGQDTSLQIATLGKIAWETQECALAMRLARFGFANQTDLHSLQVPLANVTTLLSTNMDSISSNIRTLYLKYPSMSFWQETMPFVSHAMVNGILQPDRTKNLSLLDAGMHIVHFLRVSSLGNIGLPAFQTAIVDFLVNGPSTFVCALSRVTLELTQSYRARILSTRTAIFACHLLFQFFLPLALLVFLVSLRQNNKIRAKVFIELLSLPTYVFTKFIVILEQMVSTIGGRHSEEEEEPDSYREEDNVLADVDEILTANMRSAFTTARSDDEAKPRKLSADLQKRLHREQSSTHSLRIVFFSVFIAGLALAVAGAVVYIIDLPAPTQATNRLALSTLQLTSAEQISLHLAQLVDPVNITHFFDGFLASLEDEMNCNEIWAGSNDVGTEGGYGMNESEVLEAIGRGINLFTSLHASLRFGTTLPKSQCSAGACALHSASTLALPTSLPISSSTLLFEKVTCLMPDKGQCLPQRFGDIRLPTFSLASLIQLYVTESHKSLTTRGTHTPSTQFALRSMLYDLGSGLNQATEQFRLDTNSKVLSTVITVAVLNLSVQLVIFALALVILLPIMRLLSRLQATNLRLANIYCLLASLGE